MQLLSVRRALVSVTDKTGISELGSFLSARGVEIISTGGTKKILKDSGVPVTSVSDVTGFPEILGGRVKTLHPFIHAGILADKDNPEHIETLAGMNIQPIDIVCVNLYAFERAIQDDPGIEKAVEQIDIGGPTLLRAAAKNHSSICVLPDPEFYQPCMDMLQKKKGIDLEFRIKTASYTFAKTSRYDQVISGYFNQKI
ncbi:IMP cyclohydrolase [Desulfonatronospira sp.]|uniref:IMP cyclohydrolase n=1 Tax=Desulfonatronospira sp. TaxID=1962951 RepID=UPI0025BF751E|nr:IMP cyclohydrolase [Desulfonatronospira sp.]